MARWLWMIAGLVIWAVQFCLLYALASLADVVATADDGFWRLASAAVSVACVAACALILADAIRRRRRSASFHADLAALSAGAGCIAVIWQALPLAITG